MKTLLSILSSPRKGGNSEMLTKSFARGAEGKGWDISEVRINDLSFRPCQACDHCASTGECVVQDDMQSIYPLVSSAHAMVVSTPVFFGTLSAQLKMFIDRFQCWWHAKYNLNNHKVKLEDEKTAFFICVGALKKKEYCENALAVAKIYFHNVNYNFSDFLFYRGIDEKGAIKKHPDALQEAYEAGRRLAGENLGKDDPQSPL